MQSRSRAIGVFRGKAKGFGSRIKVRSKHNGHGVENEN